MKTWAYRRNPPSPLDGIQDGACLNGNTPILQHGIVHRIWPAYIDPLVHNYDSEKVSHVQQTYRPNDDLWRSITHRRHETDGIGQVSTARIRFRNAIMMYKHRFWITKIGYSILMIHRWFDDQLEHHRKSMFIAGGTCLLSQSLPPLSICTLWRIKLNLFTDKNTPVPN